jgi:transcriptional regulator with XRE-family HTH domain
MKEKVAERIRITRLSKGLSQQNIADDLGITVAAYSNIERGVTDVSVSRVYQIATILQVNPFSLFVEQKEDVLNDSANPMEGYSSSLTQQVYMLIQQVQQLNTRLDELEREVAGIKRI